MNNLGKPELPEVVGTKKGETPDVPSESSLPSEQIREHRRHRSQIRVRSRCRIGRDAGLRSAGPTLGRTSLLDPKPDIQIVPRPAIVVRESRHRTQYRDTHVHEK